MSNVLVAKPYKFLVAESELSNSGETLQKTMDAIQNERNSIIDRIITDINTGDDDFIIREDDEEISKIEMKQPASFEINKEDLKPTISNASDFSMLLLEEAHVATVTGEAFGNEACIRISYAASVENIQEAVGRIASVLK